ncbi:MAG: prepilin-type N-terminal cleavage/methylation domain-containing protein [Bdellovibrionales bacterium]|nr:prepilin-type N-terminal cleavage/methylation domain-containing protein [Bdellovibrionales bacterium]
MNIKNNKGFSLIEVLVTVGLIGVLVGIAVPSYNKYKESTNTVAIQADLGNGGKVYTAYDAVNGTFCANWDDVGLRNSGVTVFEKANLYKRDAFIGFSGLETDCAGITLTDAQYKSADLTAGSVTSNAECTKYGGTWASGTSTCTGGTYPTGYAYSGTTSDCKLGSSQFKMGATSFQVGGAFYAIDDKGVVSTGSGDCP